MKIPSRASLQFTTKYTRDFLQGMRREGDELADAVVAELHRRNGLTNIHDLLGTVEKYAAAEPNSVFAAFLAECARVPSWVDADAVERGQRVQAVYSTVMGPSLFAGSLVGGAMFRSAALVTAMAGNLGDNPVGRTYETALIIAHLVFPGALLSPTGASRTALIRVRLLHAGLRKWLVTSGRYTRKDEVAINQHDMAITLALFGYVNIRSLYLMGVTLTPQEMADYIHMWRFGGFLLGIREDILPTSLKDQEEFFLASCIDEAHPESIPVAVRGILDAMAQSANKETWGVVPYTIAQKFLYQITRFLCGNEYVEGMQLPDEGDSSWPVLMLRMLGTSTSFLSHTVPYGADFLAYRNRTNIQGLLNEHKKKTASAALGGRINVASNHAVAITAKSKM